MTTGRKRRLCVLAAAGLVATSLLGSAADGATRAKPKLKRHTYSGSCKVDGTATGYSPPLSVRPAARRFSFKARGTCTGKMDRAKRAKTIAVTMTVKGRTTVDGCPYGITEGARGSLRGTGSASARTLRVGFRTIVLIDGLDVMTGIVADRGGAAVGKGTIQADQATVEGCIDGTLRTLRFALSMRTVDPLVFYRRASR